MEFDITASKMIKIVTKATFTTGITTLRIEIGKEEVVINAVAVSNDRLIQLKMFLEENEEIIEEGIWDIGDPNAVLSKLKVFKSTDIINVKLVDNKVQITRKKPKKAYKLPVGIESQMLNLTPVEVILDDGGKLGVLVKRSGDLQDRGVVEVKFSVEQSVLKELAKESLYLNTVNITYSNEDEDTIYITGETNDNISEEEIVAEILSSHSSKVTTKYAELTDIFKVLSSDAEIVVNFSKNEMMVIEEKNKYMKVQYIIMPIIEED